MIDNHLHTVLCKHAMGKIEEYVESAIARGIKTVCFTDHIPLPDKFDITHRMTRQELDLYARWITNAQKQYSEIQICFGIEADYLEGFEAYTEKILTNYDFDLVIMSVHFIRHWPEGNWVFDYHFPGRSNKEIYSDYLQTVRKGIQTGLFDVVGHIDMIKKNGDSLIKHIPQEVIKTLQLIKTSGMAIEINSSGYRKGPGEPYPGFDWIPQLKTRQIPISIGSDAHSPEQVGLNFEHIYKYIIRAGMDHILTYQQRKKYYQKI